MLDQRGAQRVNGQEHRRKAREGTNSDRERDRQLHEDRNRRREHRHRQAILHHLADRARIVPHLPPAEDQKQSREREPRGEDDRVVDAACHNATVRRAVQP